ncbi:hypothetical protein EDC01DRAFT_784595 [Geopyxis carbonaria]|nr:hypothetical protein EDC01DRAFT_784595 [Geopyxis carbonaria]
MAAPKMYRKFNVLLLLLLLTAAAAFYLAWLAPSGRYPIQPYIRTDREPQHTMSPAVMRPATVRNHARAFSTARRTLEAVMPSQVKGHARWIAGCTETALGTLTFSRKLKAAGAVARASGITEMRAAKQIGDLKVRQKMEGKGPVTLSAEGRGEGMVGRLLGCQGMRERGEWKVGAARGKLRE